MPCRGCGCGHEEGGDGRMEDLGEEGLCDQRDPQGSSSSSSCAVLGSSGSSGAAHFCSAPAAIR